MKYPGYIGFSKAKQLDTLRDRVDATLREMKTDGTWQRIVDSHIRSWGPPQTMTNPEPFIPLRRPHFAYDTPGSF